LEKLQWTGLPSWARKTIAASCEANIQDVASPNIEEQRIYNENKLVPFIVDNPGVDDIYVNDTVGTVPGILEDVNTDKESSIININQPSNRRNYNENNKICFSTPCCTGFT
jgi:hypothetical protein